MYIYVKIDVYIYIYIYMHTRIKIHTYMYIYVCFTWIAECNVFDSLVFLFVVLPMIYLQAMSLAACVSIEAALLLCFASAL